MRAGDEIRHVDFGPTSGETPGEAGLVDVSIVTDRPAVEVVERARGVLRAVASMRPDEMSSPDGARRRLPDWFVAGCDPERSAEADERWLAWWRSLDPKARLRAAAEHPWSLSEWLHWMDPGQRQWYWWDAHVDSARAATVTVEVAGWPTPLGSLEWLLRVAGASTTLIKQ